MLNLHSGGEEVTYEMLRQLPVPAATETHHPVAHFRLVDALKNTLGNYGHEVVFEQHAIDHDGDRYFGLLSLKSVYGDYEDVCGLRNSHDKTFPVGIAMGGAVFVCSNLSFYGQHVIRRKHTKSAWRDIHGLLAAIIEPLAEQREQQHQKLLTYKATELSDPAAHHAIMRMYKEDVIGVQRIPDVLHQWEEPAHDWGEKSVWRLFNAATFALKGRVAERPQITTQLHQIMDEVCTVQ